MKKPFFFLVLGIVLAGLAFPGCGGGDGRLTTTATIMSHQPSDGDIAYDNVLAQYTITNGPDTIYFGIDSDNVNLPEYRAFLDFPLDGSTGEDDLPLDAIIDSATLTVRVASVGFAATVPTVLDLVTYSIGDLAPVDFDSPPLPYSGGGRARRSFDIYRSDEGYDIEIDVTDLLQEAQDRGLNDFQVRFMLDPDAAAGLVGVDDRPDVSLTAPTLVVWYR